MAEIDPVILEIRADLTRYKAELRSSTRLASQAFGQQEARVRRLETEMRRSSGAISSTLKGLAGSIAAAFSVREIGGLIDNFTRFENALRVAGLEGEQLAAVQERLFATGAQYGVSVNALADLYSKAEQAGRELGASQAELLTLTEAVSQSLLVTGTSTEQASGAILGLSQALASGKVRAEEFNQINEGGLRPLLEAAAASDRFGGSVAKLRQAVLDGKLASQEFYRSILEGASIVEGKASNANITLAGAVQSLTDQLSRYFGEAGQASGVTAALADAIKALADNLDIIIPALATIAVAMGVKLVGSAVAGSTAMFALTAAMGGAATATEALAFAMNGLSRALPFLAITALVGGLALIIAETNKAAQATGVHAKTLQQSERASDAAREAAERLASAHGETRREALEAARAERELTKQKLAGARASLQEAQAELKRAQAFQAAQNQASFGSTGLPGTGLFIQGTGDTKVAQARANVTAGEKAVANFQASIDALTAAIKAPPAVASIPSPSDGKKTKAKSGPKPTGPSAAEIAARQASEINRLQQEELRARAQLTDDANERAEIERQILELERAERIAQIKSDKDLSEQQKAAQIAIVEALYGVESQVDEQGTIIATANRSLYAQQIERERATQREREAQEIADERYRAEQDGLRTQLDLVDTEEARKKLALQIFDAEQRYLESKLEAVLASETSTEAEKERARIALEALRINAADQREAVSRANETEVERYLRSLNRTPEQINEAIEAIKIDGLEALNDGLVDAIMGAKSLGEVFSNVADQIISDLLRIAIQQAVIKPLANALFGGGGGGLGSVFGGGTQGNPTGILSIFGRRATGGPVAAGMPYLVGERGPEVMVPAMGGNVISNSAIRQRAVAGGTRDGVVKVQLSLTDDIDARITEKSGQVVVAFDKATSEQRMRTTAAFTLNQAQRPRL